MCLAVTTVGGEGDFLVRFDGVHFEFVAKGSYSYGACIAPDGVQCAASR